MVVAFAACSDDSSTGDPETPVSLSHIAGVTPPAFTETPVTTITPTAQYSGTVSWSPEVTNTFTSNTVYTATITLTPKSGYILTNLPAGFFKVAGATATHDGESGVITAVFPATAITINIAAITNVSAPVHDAAPVRSFTADQYSGRVAWSPDHGRFMVGTNYTAVITLTPLPGFTLTNVPANFFMVAGATNVRNSAHFGVVTAVFPPAAAAGITVSSIQGVAAPVTGATAATNIRATRQYSGTISWSPALTGNGRFADGTAYTATITLRPEPEFTLTNVPANFFMVAGAANVSNSADSGVVTAVFPTTPFLPVSSSNIHGVTPPVVGNTPATNTIALWSQKYYGTVEWSPPAGAAFAASTVYTATITLRPENAFFSVTNLPPDFFQVAGADRVSYSTGSDVVTAIFPATGTTVPALVSLSNITNITPVVGEAAVRSFETEQYTGKVEWLGTSRGGVFLSGRWALAQLYLSAKPGFTLSGLAADFFQVAGANSYEERDSARGYIYVHFSL